MAAFGIKAIQATAGQPHILGFAAAETTADQEIFEIWNGSTNAARVFRMNKDGQLQGADGTVALPTYSFENDKDSGFYYIGANNLGLALAGAKVINYATTGVSITGTITGSGILSIDDTTDTTSTTTGSIHTDGGLGIAKALWVGTTSRLVGAVTVDGVVSIDDTTDSSSGTTGSLHTDGGIGVAKRSFLIGDVYVGGTSDTTAAAIVDASGADTVLQLRRPDLATGGTIIRLIPRGSPTSAGGVQFFNTDFVADSSNYDFGEFRYVSDVLQFKSSSSGTGTTRDMKFVAGATTALTVTGATGAVTVATALTASSTLTVAGVLSVDDTTDTTSTITGSIHTDGGLGIAKNLWVGVDATIAGDLTVSGTSLFENDVAVTDSQVGGVVDLNVSNTDSTNLASGSRIFAGVTGAGSGDPRLIVQVVGVQQYYFGLDNSDSDKLMIGAGSAVGTTPFLTFTTAGVLTVAQDTTISGDLVVSGTGPHAIGGAVQDYRQFHVLGSFTSAGGSDRADKVALTGTLTGFSGDTVRLTGMIVAPTIVTQSVAETITDIASLMLFEPTITKNVTTITDAATLMVVAAPSEGATNNAILVKAGNVEIRSGTFSVSGAITASGGVDGVVGGVTPAAGTFTTLSTSGLATLTDLLVEDSQTSLMRASVNNTAGSGNRQTDIEMSAQAGEDAYIGVNFGGAAGFFFDNRTTGSFVWYDTGTERMTLTAAGALSFDSDLTVGGDGTVTGDLTVSGTGDHDFSGNISIEGNNIWLKSRNAADSADIFLIEADTSDRVRVGNGGTAVQIDGTTATVTGDLVVSGTGPHAFGSAASGWAQMRFGGSLISDGSSTEMYGIFLNSVLTGASGDTGQIAGLRLAPSITTQAAAEAIGVAATLYVDEPNITIGTATVTNAASLYIAGAPDEATTGNYALWVDAGTTRLDGDVIGNATDIRFRGDAAGSGGVLLALAKAGLLTLNDTLNADMTIGLTINQGANDDQSLALKSSDVGHPMTGQTEPDTYAGFYKNAAAAGGLEIIGFRDADGAAARALSLKGYLGEAADTTKTTSGAGVIDLNARVTDGGTSVTDVGADGNLVTISTNATTRFIFDAEGTAHADDVWTDSVF